MTNRVEMHSIKQYCSFDRDFSTFLYLFSNLLEISRRKRFPCIKQQYFVINFMSTTNTVWHTMKREIMFNKCFFGLPQREALLFFGRCSCLYILLLYQFVYVFVRFLNKNNRLNVKKANKILKIKIVCKISLWTLPEFLLFLKSSKFYYFYLFLNFIISKILKYISIISKISKSGEFKIINN